LPPLTVLPGLDRCTPGEDAVETGETHDDTDGDAEAEPGKGSHERE
jgi:hypothetical protein